MQDRCSGDFHAKRFFAACQGSRLLQISLAPAHTPAPALRTVLSCQRVKPLSSTHKNVYGG
jgi:hypothetical protein